MTNNEYKIQLVNVDTPLPVEVLTEMGTAKFIIDKKGVDLKSNVLSQIEPDSYYLKKVFV